MYYVIFGDGEIRPCESLEDACDKLRESRGDDEFWEEEIEMLRGKYNAFVIIKGEQVHVEQVWRAAKEEK